MTPEEANRIQREREQMRAEVERLTARVQELESELRAADVVDVGVIKHLNAQLATARDAALEEAAAVCEGIWGLYDEVENKDGTQCARLCADRILVLKAKQPEAPREHKPDDWKLLDMYAEWTCKCGAVVREGEPHECALKTKPSGGG